MNINEHVPNTYTLNTHVHVHVGLLVSSLVPRLPPCFDLVYRRRDKSKGEAWERG